MFCIAPKVRRLLLVPPWICLAVWLTGCSGPSIDPEALSDAQILEQQILAETLGEVSEEEPESLNFLAEKFESIVADRKHHLVHSVLTKMHDVTENVGYEEDVVGYYLRGFEVLPENFYRDRGNIANELGIIYSTLEDYPRAIDYFEQSIELFSRSSTPDSVTFPIGNVADLYEEMGMLDQALEYNLRTLDHSRKLPQPERTYNLIFDNYRIGGLYAQMGEDTLAINSFQDAVASARLYEDPDISALAFVSILEFLLDRNRAQEATPYVEEVNQNYIDDIESSTRDLLAIELTKYYTQISELDKARAELEILDFEDERVFRLRERLALAENDEQSAMQALRAQNSYMQLMLDDSKKRATRNAEAVMSFQRQTVAFKSQEEARASRTVRDRTIGLAALGLVFAFIYFRVDSIRRAERKLKEKERDNNRKLTQLVEHKTVELVKTMEQQGELERQLEHQRRTEAIGQLTGGVAHDMNNVLQVVQTANEVIGMEHNRLSTTQQSMLATSNESVETATRIVQQLLAFARRQHLIPVTVNVKELLLSKRDLLRTTAGDRNNLVVTGLAEDAYIHVDTAQLISSLINLIANARDATSDGAEIVLAVQKRDVATSGLTGFDTEDVVEMTVRDHGSGMTTDEVAKCCEPFYTTKEIMKGTGLGLSTVQGFVQQSGGQVRIESQPGVGTSVQLLFPAVEKPAEMLTKSHLPTSSLAPLNVLIVEDTDSVARAIKFKLDSLGMQTTVVACADDAILALKGEQSFDLVLSDIQMPGSIDGNDLRRWIEENHPSTNVILMTGFAASPEQADSRLILPKPFTDEQFMEMLSRLPSTKLAERPAEA